MRYSTQICPDGLCREIRINAFCFGFRHTLQMDGNTN